MELPFDHISQFKLPVYFYPDINLGLGCLTATVFSQSKVRLLTVNSFAHCKLGLTST